MYSKEQDDASESFEEDVDDGPGLGCISPDRFTIKHNNQTEAMTEIAHTTICKKAILHMEN